MTNSTAKKVEKVTNFIVSVGAAIVIMGALAKLTHHRLADIMLTIGLCTEAVIFLMYAFLPPIHTTEDLVIEKLSHIEKLFENGGNKSSSVQSTTLDTEPISQLNKLIREIFNR